MARYLLHQNGNGDPVGVFTPNDHYYFPSTQNFENYGTAVVLAKGPNQSWNDFIEYQASKSPSPQAQWDIYEHAIAPLYNVLKDASNDTI